MSETEAVGGDTTLLSPEPTTTSIETYIGEGNVEWATAKGIKTVEDLPKLCDSHRELEKMSSSRVKMPTPESSAEEIRAFYQRTGCPENPEGYETPVVEGTEMFRDEGTENALKQVAYDYGVPKQAFEAIVKGYYDKLAADMNAGRESGEASLKEEWTDKYNENLKISQRFAGTCSDEFRALMESTGLGNNPIVVKEFLEKGKQTMSDTLILGTGDDGENKTDYVPKFKNSPDQYATMEGEEGEMARAWFVKNKGHQY